MFERIARPCMNLHGIYRRFDVVHLVFFCLPMFSLFGDFQSFFLGNLW
jgi:hypothetical protein